MTLEEAVKFLEEECPKSRKSNFCADCPLYDKNFVGDTCICALLSQAQSRLKQLEVREKANAQI